MNLYTPFDYYFSVPAKVDEEVEFTISFPISSWDGISKSQQLIFYECPENDITNPNCDNVWMTYFKASTDKNNVYLKKVGKLSIEHVNIFSLHSTLYLMF